MPVRGPILNQLNVVSADMRASIAFYRRLGIGMPQGQDAEAAPFHVNGRTQAGFKLELDSVPFAPMWNAGWVGRDDLAGRVVIGFDVETRDEVDEVYRELTGAGAPGLAAPFDAFWGARYAIVEDPNGVAIGLMSPIDPQRRAPLPADWED